MRLIFFIIFVFINFFSLKLHAQTIAIINIQQLIDQNNQYIEKIYEIEKIQNIYYQEFNSIDDQINELLEEIENSKLILNQDELNLLINNYNNELNDFKNLVDDFNLHYQNQILKIRDNVLNQIIILLEQYANENNVDLILDSTSYLIASNTLDITGIINNELKKINLELNYEPFKKN